MQFDTPLAWVPELADAIERHPLTVQPDTPLVDAIALISQAHSHTCSLAEEAESLASSGQLADGRSVKPVASASCLLVMQERNILGILTERDVVRLTAQSVDLHTATVTDVMVHPVITLPEQSVQDIFAALFLFRRYRIRHLPIVDDQKHLVGVISHESIRQVLRPANLLRFRRVSDVMTAHVIHASLTASVLHLAQLMAAHRVSCVVITQLDTEDTEQPVGIVTERDIVQFQALQIDLSTTAAQTVMSSPLFLLSPQDSLWTAHQEMQKRRVGRLVVSWNWGKGLGIVTQTSLLRVFDPMEMYGVIENLQQTIQQMESQQSQQESSSSFRGTEPQPSVPKSQNPLFDNQNPSLSSQTTTGDRTQLLSLLNHVNIHVKKLITDSNLSENQMRSQLKSVLSNLEQLYSALQAR